MCHDYNFLVFYVAACDFRLSVKPVSVFLHEFIHEVLWDKSSLALEIFPSIQNSFFLESMEINDFNYALESQRYISQ